MVIGHESFRKQIIEAEVSQRTSHAYLLLGPEGIGKSVLARWSAQYWNCQDMKKENPEPCGRCSFCQKISRGQFLDLIWIEPDEEQGSRAVIKVESVRELHPYLGVTPVEGKVRVIVIRDAHRLNFQAQTALLKILEEPPEYTRFILSTHQPDDLLSTIHSRCQTRRLSPLSEDEVRALIKSLNFEHDQLELLTPLAQGQPGLILKNPDELLKEREEFFKLFDQIAFGGYAGVQKALASLSKKSGGLERFIKWFQLLLRDLSEKQLTGSLRWFADKEESFKELQGRLSLNRLTLVYEKLLQSAESLSQNANKNTQAQMWAWELRSMIQSQKSDAV
jgi:DNA polymerase-3 subunit delta'